MAVAVALLLAAAVSISPSQGLASIFETPESDRKATRPSVHDTKECWYDEQRLDHFTYKRKDARWKQRYLIYQLYWKEQSKTGPIFFYGNFHGMHDKQLRLDRYCTPHRQKLNSITSSTR